MLHNLSDNTLSVSSLVNDIARNHRTGDWAIQHYRETILNLISALRAKRVMEIGGGRWPLLSPDDLNNLGIDYIVNDVSERELALAPKQMQKACFNIAQDSIDDYKHLFGRVDLVFSNNVFEHVPDVHKAYRNIQKLLSPGGVCLNFHPVLYSPPFVVNWLFPEWLSSRLLRLFFPNRHDGDTPKYPAYYDHCKATLRERDALLAQGYRNAWLLPFWNHGYFDKIPVLYSIDAALMRIAERNDWRLLASHCYSIVMK